MCWGLLEVRRLHRDPLDVELQATLSCLTHRCWKSNSGLLQEQYVFLATELFLQHPFIFSYFYVYGCFAYIYVFAPYVCLMLLEGQERSSSLWD